MMLALKIYVLFIGIMVFTFLFVYITNKFLKNTIFERFVKKHIVDDMSDKKDFDI